MKTALPASSTSILSIIYYRIHTSFSAPNLLQYSSLMLVAVVVAVDVDVDVSTAIDIATVLAAVADSDVCRCYVVSNMIFCVYIAIAAHILWQHFFGCSVVIKLKTFNIRHSVMI